MVTLNFPEPTIFLSPQLLSNCGVIGIPQLSPTQSQEGSTCNESLHSQVKVQRNFFYVFYIHLPG